MTRPVAPGTKIAPQLLLRAYAAGVFPMAEEAESSEVFWVQPQLRGIIPLDDFHVPKKLARTIRKAPFEIAINRDFEGVIEGCAQSWTGREKTWINDTIRDAYGRLHKMGYCHSVEAWQDGALAGGLYGVTLGGAFFGESMFTRVTDASKICLVALVERMRERGFVLLDTQFTTEHLERFGAIEVPRAEYETMLEEALLVSASFDD